jgi:hypothetical protein
MNGLVILMSHFKHPLPCPLPAVENTAIENRKNFSDHVYRSHPVKGSLLIKK